MTALRAASGILPIAVMLTMIVFEYTGMLSGLTSGLAAAAVIAFALSSRNRTNRAFVAIGALLVAWAFATRPDWATGAGRALHQGSFVIALFTALSAIRIAAAGTPAVIECGRFLARQRPGLRYLALTIGGQLFGLVLLYGSIGLLGSLAAEATSRESDPEIRSHRLRRMLVAINRGFASTLCWSPLGFSMAITLALVPGAEWSGVALPCIISGCLLMALGWTMDTVFKPRLSTPAPPRETERENWLTRMAPLLALLGTVIAGAGILHAVTGVDVVGGVMSFVPALALIWVLIQGQAGARVKAFALREMPGFSGQLLLLFMAAFIGSLGSFMLVPLMPALGLHLDQLPPLLILISLIWIIPLTGQIGMNPILAVSLLLPLLPSPAQMGIPPAAMVAAVTGGWALSGVTSPYTASVLLVGGFGQVSARHAGLRWNGPFALVGAAALSLWVTALTLWLT